MEENEKEIIVFTREFFKIFLRKLEDKFVTREEYDALLSRIEALES